MSKKKGVSAEEKRDRILHIYHSTKDVFNLKEVENIGKSVARFISEVRALGWIRGMPSRPLRVWSLLSCGRTILAWDAGTWRKKWDEVAYSYVSSFELVFDTAPAFFFSSTSSGAKAGVVQQSIADVNKSLLDDGLVDTDKIGSGNFFWSFPSKAAQKKRVAIDDLEDKCVAADAQIADLLDRIRAAKRTRVPCAERERKLRRLNELKDRESVVSKTLAANKENDPEELKRIGESKPNDRQAFNLSSSHGLI